MRVLVIGKYEPEGFAVHIAETLGEMGHIVCRFEVSPRRYGEGSKILQRLNQMDSAIRTIGGNFPAVRGLFARRLFEFVDATEVEVIVSCHDFLWPREVDELKRRSGAAICMWFPDHLANFKQGYFMNAAYDALFFKDPYIVHALGDVLKSPVYYLPECFNPKYHWLSEKEIGRHPEFECDITTAGGQHSWRVAFYKQLVGYKVKLWGPPAPLWSALGPLENMYQGRPVYYGDKVRAFRGSKVVVNNLHFGEIWGLNARAFEVAGAGAFQMLDWKPGLQQLFDDGKELISFRSVADLKKKLDFWLPRDAERCAIGEAGMARAHRDHTYKHRLNLLLGTVLKNDKGYPVPRVVVES